MTFCKNSARNSIPRAALCLVFSAFIVSSSGAGAVNSAVADAAMKGDAAAVRMLVQKKADVNAVQADGATAIQWAAYRNDLEMADILIAAGADVKLANRDGATPMRLASENGSAPMIGKLLDAEGADANERTLNGETPLMMAARNGNIAALELLLDRKADPALKEKAARHHCADVGGGAIPSRSRKNSGGARSGCECGVESGHAEFATEPCPDGAGENPSRQAH